MTRPLQPSQHVLSVTRSASPRRLTVMLSLSPRPRRWIKTLILAKWRCVTFEKRGLLPAPLPTPPSHAPTRPPPHSHPTLLLPFHFAPSPSPSLPRFMNLLCPLHHGWWPLTTGIIHLSSCSHVFTILHHSGFTELCWKTCPWVQVHVQTDCSAMSDLHAGTCVGPDMCP